MLPWNPSAHSKQDIPTMASSSWASSTASEPKKRSRGTWLLLDHDVSAHPRQQPPSTGVDGSFLYYLHLGSPSLCEQKDIHLL